jgi:hypothetical protein
VWVSTLRAALCPSTSRVHDVIIQKTYDMNFYRREILISYKPAPEWNLSYFAPDENTDSRTFLLLGIVGSVGSTGTGVLEQDGVYLLSPFL